MLHLRTIRKLFISIDHYLYLNIVKCNLKRVLEYISLDAIVTIMTIVLTTMYGSDTAENYNVFFRLVLYNSIFRQPLKGSLLVSAQPQYHVNRTAAVGCGCSWGYCC